VQLLQTLPLLRTSRKQLQAMKTTPPELSAALKAGSSLEVLRQRARASSAAFTQRQHQHVRRQGSFVSPRCGQARRSKGGARNTGIYFKKRIAQRQHAIASDRCERTRGGSAHVAHG
jgi:hypothetical protein